MQKQWSHAWNKGKEWDQMNAKKVWIKRLLTLSLKKMFLKNISNLFLLLYKHTESCSLLLDKYFPGYVWAKIDTSMFFFSKLQTMVTLHKAISVAYQFVFWVLHVVDSVPELLLCCVYYRHVFSRKHLVCVVKWCVRAKLWEYLILFYFFFWSNVT